MNYRITARGTDVELRGYVSGDANVRLLAQALDGLARVFASPMSTDGAPPTDPSLETSLAQVTAMAEEAPSQLTFLAAIAQLHFMQAMVIRGERDQREAAEKELRDRELHHFETEQKLAEQKGEA